MSLPTTPPKYTSWKMMVSAIRSGDAIPWRVYALQRALTESGHPAQADGVFGPKTEAAVIAFQRRIGLAVDGSAGARTQGDLLEEASNRVHALQPGLPDGLLQGFAEGEGANILAATNWYTPPKGAPGVDCGSVQIRVYGPPFSMVYVQDRPGLAAAFDVDKAFAYASATLMKRVANYKIRRSSMTFVQRVKCAVLAHNAPFLAEQIVTYGRLLTPDAPAAWTNNPATGQPYTHSQWAQVYPRNILKYTDLV